MISDSQQGGGELISSDDVKLLDYTTTPNITYVTGGTGKQELKCLH